MDIPVNCGIIPKSCATMAELLKQNGYTVLRTNFTCFGTKSVREA